ncbi:MAG: DUF21 domain-containing protein [Legionellaceae bacterium]|nr:DUF21 domain-containing protein [Legionellaceae bacterium]
MQFSLPELFLLLVFLLFILAFFSLAEIALTSFNRYRLKHLVKIKHRQAICVEQLLKQPERLRHALLMGKTLATIIAAAIATLIGQRLYGLLGIASALIILLLAEEVIATRIPHTLASRYPEKIALRLAPLLKRVMPLLAPLTALSNGLCQLLLWRREPWLDTSLKQAGLSSEELRSVLHEAGILLPEEHHSMLLSLLDLGQATVEDIMIPKHDILGLDLNLPWHELRDQLETTQHTRLPLFAGSPDHVVGIVHMRDVLGLALTEKLDKDSLQSIAQAPYFIPEATALNQQILNFQKHKQRSSFVVDEYGDVLGLVTLEDILEEVVGEFTTDLATFSKDISPQEDGSFMVNASITIRQLNRLLNLELPQTGPRTLSGFIIEHLGYIPPADCCLRVHALQIDILRVRDNTIKTVRVQLL